MPEPVDGKIPFGEAPRRYSHPATSCTCYTGTLRPSCGSNDTGRCRSNPEGSSAEGTPETTDHHAGACVDAGQLWGQGSRPAGREWSGRRIRLDASVSVRIKGNTGAKPAIVSDRQHGVADDDAVNAYFQLLACREARRCWRLETGVEKCTRRRMNISHDNRGIVVIGRVAAEANFARRGR